MSLRSEPVARFVRGAAELEETARGVRPHRLPAWVRDRYPDPQLLSVESHPSGVRLLMETEARTVELVLHPTCTAYAGLNRPRGSVDLVVDGEVVASSVLVGGDVKEVDLRTGEAVLLPGEAQTERWNLAEGTKVVEIWLPHNEMVDLVALRADAPLWPVEPGRRIWLHHGSSISHGSNAATPTAIWPAVAARLGGVELHNLGLGGSAVVDPFTARVMRDRPADLISVKLGINVVNFDAMRLRAFVPAVHGFLDTIRDGHPETPLVLVSPIFCGIHEDTPGPGALDLDELAAGRRAFIATGTPEPGRLTLKVVREALESVVEGRDDANLHYLDGLRLYGVEDAVALPLPDALHPDTAAHRLIGERFARYAFEDGGPFG
ncbi:GDSL-type esterase/lipase family protein [Lentzea guizhouensis]|uniref:GDSL-type esterase/lipase family protein n=1 Tax=Lentzea guizhouensis TaxID=1586287 RepID=UPI001F2993BE|nr:SGNH/GDSL hydrolase family protein [Lentzea guizhouensis]